MHEATSSETAMYGAAVEERSSKDKPSTKMDDEIGSVVMDSAG
jgi:hypothetical protein